MPRKKIHPHIHTPFHINYLTFLPLIGIIVGIFFAISLIKAQKDLKNIGLRMRYPRNMGLREGVIYYKVQQGDTLESLAVVFNISENTILWANDQLSPDALTPDLVILIPPVTGVVHTVKYLETLEGIAKMYGVDPEAIVNYPFNDFSTDEAFPLTAGQTIIVPGGKK